MATINFTDRLYRKITATDLGYRTIRSLRVGDYVMATSSHDGATDWRRVLEIGELEPARFSRGKFRTVTLETVTYGWDENGAHRPTPRRQKVSVFLTDDDIRIARPIN